MSATTPGQQVSSRTVHVHPGHHVSSQTTHDHDALARPGEKLGTPRITAQDVRKASFHKGQTPAQNPPHQKKQQQRFGIRLSKKSKGKETKLDGWLVPPHLMAPSMISVDTGEFKAEVRQPLKGKPQKRARPQDVSSSSSSDSSDSDSDDESTSTSSSSSSSSDECSDSASKSKSSKRGLIRVAEKQSGVIGVHWRTSGKGHWVATFNENGKSKCESFPLSRYKTDDNTWEYADAKALKEAIKCRQRKAKEGKNVMNVHGHRAARVSGVKGVTWNHRRNSWDVRISVKGKNKCVRTFPAMNDCEDAVEEARVAAVACRKKYEAKYYRVQLSQSASGGA